MNFMIEKLYNFLVSIQVIMFMIFLIHNINDLEEIDFTFTIVDYTIEITINFYLLVGIIGVLYLISIPLTMQVAGSGMSDSGTTNLNKYVSMITMFILLSIGVNYYFGGLGVFGLIINLFSVIVYTLHTMNDLGDD